MTRRLDPRDCPTCHGAPMYDDAGRLELDHVEYHQATAADPDKYAALRARVQRVIQRDRDRAQEARVGADIMRTVRAAGINVPPPDIMPRAVALYRDARAARDNRAPRASAE